MHMTKHASEFETKGRHHQKSKTGMSVAPQKGLMSSKIKKNLLTLLIRLHSMLARSQKMVCPLPHQILDLLVVLHCEHERNSPCNHKNLMVFIKAHTLFEVFMLARHWK